MNLHGIHRKKPIKNNNPTKNLIETKYFCTGSILEILRIENAVTNNTITLSRISRYVATFAKEHVRYATYAYDIYNALKNSTIR